MSSRAMLIFVGISGFFYVALGAMGAHMLAPVLTSRQMEWIHTGLQYQGLHTLAMMALAVLSTRQPVAQFGWSGIFFLSGNNAVQWQSLLSGFSTAKIFSVFNTNWWGQFSHWLVMCINWRSASKEIGA